jgi:4'-phosphopantetheinyl transferase EntD
MAEAISLRSSVNLAALLPNAVSCRELDVPGDPGTLLPAEVACAEGFGEKRLREFAAGRYCARLALGELGAKAGPLLVGHDHVPLWPAGFSGSITHANRYCAAAVCRTGAIASLGIDAETVDAVDRSVWSVLFRPSEIAWLESLPEPKQNAMASVLFSGKEAYFKCQFPLTRTWVDFTDVELRIGEGLFVVQHEGAEIRHRVVGAFGMASDSAVVVTTVVARRR